MNQIQKQIANKLGIPLEEWDHYTSDPEPKTYWFEMGDTCLDIYPSGHIYYSKGRCNITLDTAVLLVKKYLTLRNFK